VAGAGGEHLDHLAPDEGGVDVEDDEALAAPDQALALHRDVEVDRGGHLHQRRTQRPVGRLGVVRHRDVQLQAGDRVVRDAADRVDVHVELGHGAGHLREGARADRPPQHHHRVRRPGPRRREGVGAELDRQPHAGVGHRALHRAPQGVRVAGAGDEHAQHQLAPDHDLLHVEHGGVVDGEHGEQGRGDAGVVRAGDGDEHGAAGGARQRGGEGGHAAQSDSLPARGAVL
jgi:hypothetical protein